MRFHHIEEVVEVFESHSRTLRLHLDCTGEPRRQVWIGAFLSQFMIVFTVAIVLHEVSGPSDHWPFMIPGIGVECA
jgi:hypothetical protein